MDDSRNGSGRPVSDYKLFCEGDVEPSLNKKIDTLIRRSNSFIVYLDDEYYVEWQYNESYGNLPDRFGDIANPVSYLESLSVSLLAKRQLRAFRRLLGEAIARVFDERGYENAEKIIKQAEEFLRVRSLERAKTWYWTSSSVATGVLLMIFFLIWLRRPSFLSAGAYEISLVSLLGSIGAFMSIISRLKNISVNASAGPLIHCLEGAVRIVVGVGGAFLVALAVKAQLILGASMLNTFYIHAIVGIVAGASERFVPNLIKRFEEVFSSVELKTG